MVLIAKYVAHGQSNVPLKQVLQEFGTEDTDANYKEFDVLNLKQVL